MKVGEVFTIKGEQWRVALVLRDGGLALIPAQYQDLASSPRVWNVPADKVDPRPKEVIIAGAVFNATRPGFFEFKRDA